MKLSKIRRGIMRKFIFLLIIAGVFSLFQCKETEIYPPSNQENFNSAAHQITGCLSNDLKKSVENTDVLPGCFDYDFGDTLSIDFCVYGNCCPDSERFSIESALKYDTIFVVVIDTALEECDCICKYKIHLDISGLVKNEYLFYCNALPPISAVDTIKYRETVYR
jgi:hypothetical protein